MISGAADALIPLTGNKRLPLISWSDWFKKLEACSTEDMQRIPGLKLLSFFRSLAAGDSTLRELPEAEAMEREALGLVKLATDKLRILSPTTNDMPTLSKEDPALWISYWRSKGLFDVSV